MSNEVAARRPLKSRSSAWAGYFSRQLLRLGFRPNGVSLLSLVFAGVAGGAVILGGNRGGEGWMNMPASGWWLLAAVCIQLRLFCNLMDGLLAVEGGLKSRTGDLFNEIPDRVADAMILVPFGYAAGTPLGVGLGWGVAVGAVFTAYVRALGASLTGRQDFAGPMAKPHRMAAATLICFGMLSPALRAPEVHWIEILLMVIALGILVTSLRRIRRLVSSLPPLSPS